MKQYIQLNKEYKDLQPIIESYQKYKNILSNIENAKEMLKDDEMKEMAKMELEELIPKQEKLEEEIKVLLIKNEKGDWFAFVHHIHLWLQYLLAPLLQHCYKEHLILLLQILQYF